MEQFNVPVLGCCWIVNSKFMLTSLCCLIRRWMQPQGFRLASKSSYPISRYLKVTSVPLAADSYKMLSVKIVPSTPLPPS